MANDNNWTAKVQAAWPIIVTIGLVIAAFVRVETELGYERSAIARQETRINELQSQVTKSFEERLEAQDRLFQTELRHIRERLDRIEKILQNQTP